MIYEDALLKADVAEKGLVEGHVKVHPKTGKDYLEDHAEEEIEHIFIVTSKIASSIFETLGAQGTNIIINNGLEDQLTINIIPRFENDNIDFQWKAEQAKPENLDKVMKKLKEHTDYIGINASPEKVNMSGQEEKTENDKPAEQTEPTEPAQEKGEESKNMEEEPEEDYRIRQLDRIP
ncbi:MAG: HIT family protein [Nanobdellota archaeon]